MADSALTAPAKELPTPETIAKVLLSGDLSQLDAKQKVSYYGGVCDSVGLNPLTKPFEFISLSGKLVLYATRNATDQLRKIYGISVTISARETIEDCYVVTARATMPGGRHDESTGVVAIAGTKGEFRANLMLKCETKAKRRVTLSLVGLSTLDESEVESIPGAQPVAFDPVPPAPARDRSRARVLEKEPAGEVSAAAPADLNAVPESWKPFVRTEAITTTITGGKRSKSTGKTTLLLEGGAECWTTDHDLASAAIRYKEVKTPVTITLLESGEIVTLSEATNAAF